MKQLITHHTLTVKEYEDGNVKIEFLRLDPRTHRVIPEHLMELQQSEQQPLTTSELMLMAAAERVARALGYQIELPF